MNEQIRKDFPITESCIYLDTAYISPQPYQVLRAGFDFAQRRSAGVAGRVPEWVDKSEIVKGKLASLLNVKPQTLAFTTNTSDGTNLVANLLDMQEGENVIWEDLEYPSNKLIWLKNAERLGFENRVVMSIDGSIDIKSIEEKIDKNTRVITVSYVTHGNGFRHDIRAICEMAHAHDVYVHVDAIQAVGSFEIDLIADGVDFLTCGFYKWLLGPKGLAFFYIREGLLDHFEPYQFGWMQVQNFQGNRLGQGETFYQTARKFQTATLHFQGIYEIDAALDYLFSVGMQEIEEQVLVLGQYLYSGLKDLGIQLLTPEKNRSGIVSCQVPDGIAAEALFNNRQVVAKVTGNEIRFSPNFFNTLEEIEVVLDLMSSLK
ncbi:MAG: aminotransferase class V-fold PLP-dependent enzyme [Anaerolineaceae bacterium]|nr:aminotransferase class V-fold PLP-dependent enzyme [Anaerolineaceae bacterium]